MAQTLATIMAVFAVIGAVDKITGNRLRLGNEFEKGIMTLGPLSLSMLGMMTIAPALAGFLIPIITPVAEFIGFDPSAVAGILIANDVLLGLLCGIVTIPIGCFVSGIIMGIAPKTLFVNLSPALLISAVIVTGLLKFPVITVRIFSVFGKFISALITCGLALGIFQTLTGKTVLKNTAPLSESALTVFTICITLAGTFPLIAIVSRIFKKPLLALGKKTGLDETAVIGLVSTLANSIATFEMSDKMNRKGRIMNYAFAVSAAFVFGDHLAFTLSYNPQYIVPVIAGKLAAGVTALAVSAIFGKKQEVNYNGI